MRVLVIYAHPVATSYVAAMRDAVLRGLAVNGHEARVIDLYAEGFDPRLSASEFAIYNDNDRNQATLAGHIAARSCPVSPSRSTPRAARSARASPTFA